jgi:uncharacterized protein with PIN domain
MRIVDVKQFVTNPDGSRRYAWTTISADDALKLAEPRLRCPECKGAIGLFRRSEDDATANRAEHKKRNPGCSLGEHFDGTHRLADNPIEPNEESVQQQSRAGEETPAGLRPRS